MTKTELIARELTRVHVMTKKIDTFVMSHDVENMIEFWVDEFWHLFEDEAENLLKKLEEV